MAQIQRGFTFEDGGSGDASELHSLVDDAVILPGFVTDQANAAPAGTDSFVYYKSAAGLRKCTLSQLVAAFPTDAAANVASLRKLGTSAGMAAAGNDARFPAQVTGLRKGNGTSADTAAQANDVVFPKDLANGATVDFTTGGVFYASLNANRTYTLTNGRVGQTVVLLVKLNGHTTGISNAVLGGSLPTVGSGTTAKEYHLTITPYGVSGYCINL